MAIRNSFRTRRAVLLSTLLASSSAALGCNVYTDELLGKRDDGDETRDAGITFDATARDGAALDGAVSDARADGSGPVTDAIVPDAPWAIDGAIADSEVVDATLDTVRPTSDGAPPDGGTFDARNADAPFDARSDTIVSRDTPADSTVSDAGGTRDTTTDALNDAPLDTGTSDGGTIDVGSDTTDAGGPPTFRVVRVGDGTTSLSASSTPAFVEERRWDGSLVDTIALPVTTNGAQGALTLSGIATSEGALSLSLDGRYLTLAGYDAAPGRSSVAQTTDVDRIVARIDAAGNVDTTTRLGETFDGANPRCAVSVDGTSFWVGGSAGGVWYFPFAGAAGAQIVDSPDNVRLVALFGDRLYGSSGTSPMTTVFTVGTGRPTSGVQNVAALAGMPRSGMSPYAFVLFDRDPQVAGLDTLYLTDDRSPESDGSGGGVQKWTYDGKDWSRIATFYSVGSGSASFRGLTGIVAANGVTLVATSADAGGNRLVVFVDEGSTNPVGTVIATAPANTMFRGVAVSPR
ncbi:MAG: hypothetical protein ABW133_02955 [Polyangiaceae bacterium]